MVRLLSILCCLSLVSAAQAEIIIDDFDDTAILSGPVINEFNNVIEMSNVGALGITRTLGFGSSRAVTEGQIDSNATLASHLTAEVNSIEPLTPTDTPLVAMAISYRFPAFTDLTEKGRNNALFFDFTSLNGFRPPEFFRIWVFDDVVGNSFQRFYRPPPLSQEPFTLVVPFDTIVSRGGGPFIASFQRTYFLTVHFRADTFSGVPEEQSWRAELDRIRVGRVPEPSTFGLALMAIAFLLQRRFR